MSLSKQGNWIHRFFGSVCFLGYIPGMPGTIGSAVGGGLAWLLLHERATTPGEYIVLLALLSIPVFYFAERSEASFGRSDPSAFVLDEVLGQMITFIGIAVSPKSLLIGFLYFRFFDIVKPYPIGESQRIEAGVGVVYDDILAGLASCALLHATLIAYHTGMAYLAR